MKISEKIFEIMKQKGITQLELSHSTGIGQSTISDWKKKKTNPTAEKLMKICEALEVDIYELLWDTMTADQKAKKINDDLESGKITLNEARAKLGLQEV